MAARALILLILAVVPLPAFGWGHLPDLRDPEGSAHIVFAAVERSRIGYCTQINDSRFSGGDIDIKVEGALRVWLAPVAELVDAPIEIEKDCDRASLDLMVVIEPDREKPTRFGRHDLVPLGDRTISRVSVNSDPRHGVELRRTDLFEFVPQATTAAEKAAFLTRIRDEDLSLHALAAQLHLETTLPLTASVYQTLVHEIGHSFGLCDVKEALFDRVCDRRFRTRAIATAVMSTFGAFNLTFDDREGIVKLFERFVDRQSP